MITENTLKIKKEGWVLICDTICQGRIIAWTTQDDDNTEEIPEFFDTELEAQKEIARDYIEELQQFVDGTREYEYTNFGGPDETPYKAYIDEEDNIVVFDEGGNDFINMSLKQWREQR